MVKWYGVMGGPKPGAYKDWDEAKAVSHGMKGAKVKSFDSEEAALTFAAKEPGAPAATSSSPTIGNSNHGFLGMIHNLGRKIEALESEVTTLRERDDRSRSPRSRQQAATNIAIFTNNEINTERTLQTLAGMLNSRVKPAGKWTVQQRGEDTLVAVDGPMEGFNKGGALITGEHWREMTMKNDDDRKGEEEHQPRETITIARLSCKESNDRDATLCWTTDISLENLDQMGILLDHIDTLFIKGEICKLGSLTAVS